MNIELDSFAAKLRAAFEHSISAEGVTLINFSHPNAPSLLMTRNPASQPQVVPVLIAGTRAGGEWANAELGIELSKAGKEWMPLFQGITNGQGFYGIMAPFLFYRAPATGTFRAAAEAACQELSERGLLTSWFFVRCGVSYLTKDGRLHKPTDYPQALGAEVGED
jgi:hypothetical protein